MHYLLSVLAAIAVTLMVFVNGELTAVYDLYSGVVIIHVVGLALISGVCLVRRERVLAVKGLRWTAFLGGAIGVMTTMFNNEAYGKLDVSAIVALNLLAQAITSLVVDWFGLLGMPRRPMSAGKWVGIGGSVVGAIYMMSGAAFHLLPVCLSLATGVTLALSRFVNAQLAAHTTSLVSTWYNYVVGLVVALMVYGVSIAAGQSQVHAFATNTPWWIYLGGAIGVAVVLQANVSTRHIPALNMTLVLFVGQIFTGVVLDTWLKGALPVRNAVGGALVLGGLILNAVIDAKKKSQT